MICLLVTGSREWQDHALVEDALCRDVGPHPTQDVTLIHGDARGADKIADLVGRQQGWNVLPMPAQWGKLGKSAGTARNAHMASVGMALAACGWLVRVHAFPGPTSRGTWDMVHACQRGKLGVRVHGPWAREGSR